MSTQPFKIGISEDRIERLKQKLALADFPDSGPAVSESSWDYGASISDVKRLAKLWQTGYDWRKAEAHLNTFPQFISPVDIDGLGTYNIHHIHKQSTRSDAIPLLFLHGWPGSFIEVTKIVEDLVRGATDSPAFHVVAPSLIDFGFSSAGGPGFTLENHAEAYDKLMQKLGYDHYVVQGGDLGYVITRYIAKKFGSRCKAFLTNTTQPGQPNAEAHPEVHAKLAKNPLSEGEIRGLQQAAMFAKEGLGYFKQQSTKPQTLGFSLRDSPVGLLAWIYEKLHAWSDRYPWTDDEILTWISIYYFSTPGPEASSNIYYAMEHSEPTAFASLELYLDVPFGIARFPNDIVTLPALWNETLGPIVYQKEHGSGGHFAAWERPDAIVSDLRSMFSKFHVS